MEIAVWRIILATVTVWFGCAGGTFLLGFLWGKLTWWDHEGGTNYSPSARDDGWGWWDMEGMLLALAIFAAFGLMFILPWKLGRAAAKLG